MINNQELETGVKLSEAEWLEAFAPESHDIVKQLYKELTVKRNKLVNEINKTHAAIEDESDNEDYRYYWKAVANIKHDYDEQLKDIDTKLARQRRYLRIINGVADGEVNSVTIQAAKEVPIESIFDQQFRQSGNKLFGLCPFHQEKTGSFCLYKNTNRCYCFGCGAKYNVIDAYIALHKCSFNEAILTLTGGEK